MTERPSGRQHTIVHGGGRATVVEVGAGLRSSVAGGRELLDEYGEHETATSARGQVLIPWPNRLRDGRYVGLRRAPGPAQRAGEATQSTGSSGSPTGRAWGRRPAASSCSTCCTPARISVHPRGAPVLPDRPRGARRHHDRPPPRQQRSALRLRPAPLPPGAHWARGRVHAAGPPRDVPARRRARDPDGEQPVEGGDYDFRVGREVGTTKLDLAFTHLDRDEDGRAWVRLSGPDERGAAVWLDESYPYVELVTGDSSPIRGDAGAVWGWSRCPRRLRLPDRNSRGKARAWCLNHRQLGNVLRALADRNTGGCWLVSQLPVPVGLSTPPRTCRRGPAEQGERPACPGQ